MDESAHIFLKREVLAQLPANFGHPMIPILFAEAGSIPSSKNKPKKCLIVINMAGLYFFRVRKLTGIMKLSMFISTYNVTEVINSSPTRRDVHTKVRKVYFQCDHPDLAVEDLITSRAQLFFNSPDPISIKFTGFDITPTPKIDVSRPLPDLPTLRYICFCARYGFQPHQSLIDFFKTADARISRLVCLDETCEAPTNIKCLIIPIIQLGKMITFHFKGFAPFTICRFVHHILKHSDCVRNVILENYTDLVPQQFRLEGLKNKAPFTFIFRSCSFTEPVFDHLLGEFQKFPGEVQRLAFNQVSLTPNNLINLLKCISTARCMRTLEILELDQIESNSLVKNAVDKGIQSSIEHCRFLQTISFSAWTSPMNIELTNFDNCQMLTELILSKQDMTSMFNEDISFPPLVHYIDFSKSQFTIQSIQSFFKVLAKSTSPISLNMADISLPDPHWRQFLDSLPTLLSTPITCLRELNWNGNRITLESVNAFAEFFFGASPIHFLSIDRIFNPTKCDILESLFRLIPRGRLWGLSIGGVIEKNFGSNFRTLLAAINQIQPLKMLHLNGQRMTEADSVAFLEFMRANPHIEEVSVDDSAINTERKLYDFYNDMNSLNLKAIGRPIQDLIRIYGSRFENLRPAAQIDFDRMKQRFNQIGDCISPQIRAYYMCKIDPSDNFDYEKITAFSNTYPRCYFTLDSLVGSIFKEVQRAPRYKSVLCYGNKEKTITLSALHALFLQEPFKVPCVQEINYDIGTVPSGNRFATGNFDNLQTYYPKPAATPKPSASNFTGIPDYQQPESPQPILAQTTPAPQMVQQQPSPSMTPSFQQTPPPQPTISNAPAAAQIVMEPIGNTPEMREVIDMLSQLDEPEELEEIPPPPPVVEPPTPVQPEPITPVQPVPEPRSVQSDLMTSQIKPPEIAEPHVYQPVQAQPANPIVIPSIFQQSEKPVLPSQPAAYHPPEYQQPAPLQLPPEPKPAPAPEPEQFTAPEPVHIAPPPVPEAIHIQAQEPSAPLNPAVTSVPPLLTSQITKIDKKDAVVMESAPVLAQLTPAPEPTPAPTPFNIPPAAPQPFNIPPPATIVDRKSVV